jgi:hypothetical protein
MRERTWRSKYRSPGRMSNREYVDYAIACSVHASDEDKQRARAAATSLREPFAFNACLVVLASEEEPMPDRVRAEAKKLTRENERFYAKEAT